MLTQIALLLAVLGVGFLLSVRVLFTAGIVLGVTAFVVHALVSLPLTRKQAADDRVQLAIAQQNGITAIVLSLLLTPMFPSVVATVAPAIVVINALHALTNAGYSRAVPGRLSGTDAPGCSRPGRSATPMRGR